MHNAAYSVGFCVHVIKTSCTLERTRLWPNDKNIFGSYHANLAQKLLYSSFHAIRGGGGVHITTEFFLTCLKAFVHQRPRLPFDISGHFSVNVCLAFFIKME